MARNTSAKSNPKSDSRIANPRNPLSEPAAKEVANLVKRRTEALVAQHEAAKAGRPNAGERRAMTEALAKATKIDFDLIKRTVGKVNRDAGQRVFTSHNDASGVVFAPSIPISTLLDPNPLGILFGPSGNLPITPGRPSMPIDTSFWWSETISVPSAHGLDIEFAPDGEHFFGRISYDEDELLSFSARVIATFKLDESRIPPMPTGRMNSEPRIDLTGKITGWTGLKIFPWTMDDKWSKCWLVLNQTAFQSGLGLTKELGNRTEAMQLLNEDGNGVGKTVPMPGNIPMPALQIRPAANLPIFVTLEVRFDVQLEGASMITFSPAQNSAGSVLVEFSQWAPVPL